MLTENELHKIALTAVTNNSAKIIKLKKPAQKPDNKKKKDQQPAPPLDQFNTGYIKGRNNDPL